MCTRLVHQCGLSNLTSIKWTNLSRWRKRQTNGGTPRGSKSYINHESALLTVADWSIGRNSLLPLGSSLPLSLSLSLSLSLDVRFFPARVFSSLLLALSHSRVYSFVHRRYAPCLFRFVCVSLASSRSRSLSLCLARLRHTLRVQLGCRSMLCYIVRRNGCRSSTSPRDASV